jgi:hypothetical protein
LITWLWLVVVVLGRTEVVAVRVVILLVLL